MPRNLKFAGAASNDQNTIQAVKEVCDKALAELGSSPNLATIFLSADHVEHAEDVATLLTSRLKTSNVIGCSGESIVATGREFESMPAIALWLAKLPEATLRPMHLRFERSPEGNSLVGWPADLPEKWPAGSGFLVLGDPYTFPVEMLLEMVNQEHAGVPVIGGMASTASGPGENVLICGDQVYRAGAVAILADGPFRIRSLVSQGCRPIGQPYVITKAERNVILQLGGAPAYQRLVEVYQQLATSEQEMVRRGLHVGRVVSEYRDSFEQGDFLVRNVVGIDQEKGAIVVADYLRTGQTVQFHVRDAETADAELRQLLASVKPEVAGKTAGALMFTCNGRGTRLFPEPDHDATSIAKAVGDIPLAGFFAAGELGPIGGRNFIHGFTASIALFTKD